MCQTSCLLLPVPRERRRKPNNPLNFGEAEASPQGAAVIHTNNDFTPPCQQELWFGFQQSTVLARQKLTRILLLSPRRKDELSSPAD